MNPKSVDRFAEVYSRPDVAYGHTPSPEIEYLLRQYCSCGKALDLGAGAGRVAIAMAKAGLNVTAIDCSEEGVRRLVWLAREAGVEQQIDARQMDVRSAWWSNGEFDLIVATTILDHLTNEDALHLWQRMVAGMSQGGVLYVEVHTTDDPGSPIGNGALSTAPVSETADQVINYFAPGQLLAWAAREADLRVLRYEERLEWDYTHGPLHQHGKAVLLATTQDATPMWYGAPPAFPEEPS